MRDDLQHKQLNVLEIRKDFPILNRKINGKPLIYFDNAATSQTPQQVMDVITDYSLSDGMFVHKSAGIIRTARKLAEGKVFISNSIWDGDST